ncbi:hypothetical protein KC19_VG070600 [Ceratodon purpureus]|uniref:Uncharacterized protein n=1 Tax=Ceratodon purpureus TaxID=3225 RepID=A0A8T0HMW6_CERPU|nr:hypothetical protein KC19_VG070600 [Ceratodon purpureus]
MQSGCGRVHSFSLCLMFSLGLGAASLNFIASLVVPRHRNIRRKEKGFEKGLDVELDVAVAGAVAGGLLQGRRS